MRRKNHFDCYETIKVGSNEFATNVFSELNTKGAVLYNIMGAGSRDCTDAYFLIKAETNCIYIEYQNESTRVDFPYFQYTEWDYENHTAVLNFEKLAEHVKNWIDNTIAENKRKRGIIRKK